MIHSVTSKGPVEDKGPHYFLVHETSPGGAWASVAYWFPDTANDRARRFKREGKLAFVEMR